MAVSATIAKATPYHRERPADALTELRSIIADVDAGRATEISAVERAAHALHHYAPKDARLAGVAYCPDFDAEMECDD